MEKKTRLITQRGELRMKEIEVAMGVPVAASLIIKNAGTDTVLTATSIKGEDIGNATTFTIVNTTNAASVAISGTDITISAQVDTTTGTNCKALLDANTNIAALATFVGTTNKCSLLSKTAMTSGDDKLTISEGAEFAGVTLIRDLTGVYTLTMDDYKFQDYSGCMADLSGTAALSGVAKVEVAAVDSDTFTIRLANYSGVAVDVAAAGKLHLKLFDAKLP